MSLIIDASVFVAIARDVEAKHALSRQFLSRAVSGQEKLYAPALVVPESACAVTRHTGSPEKGSRIARALKRVPGLQLEPISTSLAETAADLGGKCRLRGSDACYVAIASLLDATLITWDIEMLDRGAAVVRTMTPQQWLQEQNRPASGV